MGINLTDDEHHIAEKLTDSTIMKYPLASLPASIYTVLLTRRYTGRKERIVRIVEYFNSGIPADEIGTALDFMEKRKLVEVIKGEITLPDEWYQALSKQLEPPAGLSDEFLERVGRCRRSHEAELIQGVGEASSD